MQRGQHTTGDVETCLGTLEGRTVVPKEAAPTKKCLLCARNRIMERSHFISAADIRDNGRGISTLNVDKTEDVKYVENQRDIVKWTRYLFCEECEGYFSKNLESAKVRDTFNFQFSGRAVGLFNGGIRKCTVDPAAKIQITDGLKRYVVMTIWRTLLRDFKDLYDAEYDDYHLNIFVRLILNGYFYLRAHRDQLRRVTNKTLPNDVGVGLVITDFGSESDILNSFAERLKSHLVGLGDNDRADHALEIVQDLFNNDVVELHMLSVFFVRFRIVPAVKLGRIWMFWIMKSIFTPEKYCTELKVGEELSYAKLKPPVGFTEVLEVFFELFLKDAIGYSATRRKQLVAAVQAVIDDGGEATYLDGDGVSREIPYDVPDEIGDENLLEVIKQNTDKLNMG